jgi:hypothetical protein
VLRYSAVSKKVWDRQQYVADSTALAQQMRLKVQSPETLEVVNLALMPPRHLQPVLFEEVQELQPPVVNLEDKHLVVLVHGFEANRFDLYSMRNMLLIAYPGIEVICSQANEGQTSKSIELQGRALAAEIENILGRKQRANVRLSFMGHSMGGLVVRAMVPFLDGRRKAQLHMYCSLSSPHLGFDYGSSTLLEAGLWYLNKMEKVLSIEQLSMVDSINRRNSFLYELSNNRAFSFFKRVVLVSSAQDGYIPLESARVEFSAEAVAERDKEKGRLYCEMVENMLREEGRYSLHRVEVSAVISEGGAIDKLIGRTAHIKLIQDNVILSMLASCFDHLFK